MGQQVRSVSKSDLREKKKESIHEASQLPVFTSLLHKRSDCASPQSHSFPFCGVSIRAKVWRFNVDIRTVGITREGELLPKEKKISCDDFCFQLRASVYG